MDLFSGLNPMQKEAVLTTEGPLLLLAGAGSGKTRVLTHRIAYLIEKGVSPFNIIAITFTNKAAREMKERVEKLVSENSGVWVSTFHACCVRILRREISKIDFDNSFTIYDADDAERLIKLVIKELNINDKQFPPRTVMGIISKLKDELVTPAVYEKQTEGDFRMSIIAKAYKLYQKRLKESNALDFDDIIFKTVELFLSRSDVLNTYQERFRYIMIDEYQDTNTAQYTLVRLLSQKYKNLCVVGDDDQSIYGWRGANIRNILEFEKDFPAAKVIKLEQNYRSTKIILNAANSVISNNINRKSKKLWTELAEGERITTYKADSEVGEADFITDVISQKKAQGIIYSDFAILYRTNSQSRALEDSLIRKGIPYRLFGGIRFYERREIKDVLAYLRSVYNPYDSVALKRIINVPKRGIGDTTVEKISQYAVENDLSFFDALKDVESIISPPSKAAKVRAFVDMMEKLRELSFELPVTELMDKLLEKTGYTLEMITENSEESKERLENISELIAKAAEFEKQSETPLLSVFLEEVALVSDIDSYVEGDECVVLMTLHSSKGLEFPVVFISGFEEGIFPSYRSTISGDIKQLEEERRLCYVGITRAKEKLYLTMANQRMQHGHTVYNAASSFLKEIPAEYFDTTGKKKVDVIMEDEFEINESKSAVGTFRAKISSGNKPHGFGGKSYMSPQNIPAPKDGAPDFSVGDKVRQIKYGIGEVINITPAGADYEVTVSFPTVGNKKFMAHLSKLVKV